ncbi:MAG: hypothetical protein ABGW81_11060 [Paracoccaceae bacterium]
MTVNRPIFTGSDLCACEAHEVVGLLKRGEVSPAELLAVARSTEETIALKNAPIDPVTS